MDALKILFLNDDCLLDIVSYLDDFTSFYCFALTCKRFNQASMQTKCWHMNVIKRKIRYYGTKFVIDEYPDDRKYCNNLPMIEDINSIAEIYQTTKPSLQNVMAVWRTRGPVAAEMFKWIIDIKLRQEASKHGEIEHIIKKLTVHLPVSNQDLVIDTHFNLCLKEITLRLTHNGVCLQHKIVQKSDENIFPSLSEEHVQRLMVCATKVVDILQQELGETIPSISGDLFIWFCFYPDSLKENFNNVFVDFNERLMFKDNAMNAIPTEDSIQRAIDYLHQSESLMKTIGESPNIKVVRETVKLLNGCSKMRILHNLSKEMYFILADISYLTHVSRNVILSLALRVTFLPSTFSGELESEVTHLNFRTKGGGILEVEKIGLPLGKFQSIWNFILPDGVKVHFEVEEFARWVKYGDNGPYLKLQPITELLEDCINNESTHVKLTSLFTERLFSACLFYNHCDKLYYSGVN